MNIDGETAPKNEHLDTTSRRGLLGAAAGGFALAASGLLLPEWLTEEAAARPDGAYGGQLGGRRGKDQRGRNKAKRRDRKDEHNNGDGKGKTPGTGDFNNAGLTVRNAGRDQDRPPDAEYVLDRFNVTFYAQRYISADNYDPPHVIQDTVIVDLDNAPETTVTPEFHRCGALIQHPDLIDGDLYVDVWDLPFWFPQGRVLQGKNLDPPNHKLGTEVLSQRSFIGGAFFRGHVSVPSDSITDILVFKLFRLDDGKQRVRFRLDVY